MGLRWTMPKSSSARPSSTTRYWCTCVGPAGHHRPETRRVETLRRDGEVVELNHRVRLGPETDPPGLERIVVRIEDFLSVEPDDKMVAPLLELQRVPRVRSHLDLMILKRPPAAVDHVVDRAVVFERVASRDVVVVGVAIAPHQTESLVDAPGQRPPADGESHAAQRLVLHHCPRQSIVRPI